MGGTEEGGLPALNHPLLNKIRDFVKFWLGDQYGSDQETKSSVVLFRGYCTDGLEDQGLLALKEIEIYSFTDLVDHVPLKIETIIKLLEER